MLTAVGRSAERLDRLKELVGPVPEELLATGWRAWWDERVPTWSDETLVSVWELFELVRFYDVLEVDLR